MLPYIAGSPTFRKLIRHLNSKFCSMSAKLVNVFNSNVLPCDGATKYSYAITILATPLRGCKIGVGSLYTILGDAQVAVAGLVILFKVLKFISKY